MLKCSVCMFEPKVTKTNAELKAHSAGKHSKPLDECFPGSDALSAELIAKAGAKGGQHDNNDGPTKKEKKSKDAAGLDDMLSAGLSKKKGKK